MPIDALEDPRRKDPPFVAVEREMLEAWLDFHRVTLLLKCEGLDDEQRRRRPIGSSLLSLHGLVRHMAEVERNWFQRVLGRDLSVPPLFWRPDNQDADLAPLDGASWEDDLRAWEAECDASRTKAAQHSLDDLCSAWGEHEVSLRWILVHMVEEYARHNGHADLIREMIDGSVGD